MDSFTFTVGKLDAGMAILIGDRAHLIEFPSLLLPPGVSSGSIVNIAVHRNLVEEKRQKREFWDLQDQIFDTFGVEMPLAPELQVRNVTQTSVTLEWPPIHLATATLRSLDIYRNGQRLAAIPTPLQNTSTKLSSLELNSDYTFQLILRTTAGTFPSNVVKIKTHTMSDTSGICVCFGTVTDPLIVENAKLALEEMKAKWSDRVQIDTTHFVCSTPVATPMGASATGGVTQAPGVEYQKALQASIPVVLPHWVLACHQSKKMVPISQFTLGSTPPAGLQTMPFVRPSAPGSKVNVNATPSASSTNVSSQMVASTSTFVNQPADAEPVPRKEPSPRISIQNESDAMSVQSGDDVPITPTTPGGVHSARTGKPARKRQGTMQKDFKFPPPSPTASPGPSPATERAPSPNPVEKDDAAVAPTPEKPALPSPVDIQPPTPVQKDKSSGAVSISSVDGDDEVGETVEVDLS